MPSYSGRLSGTDNRDRCSDQLEAGEYEYTLTSTGRGRVGMKIRSKRFQIEGKKVKKWKTLVAKKSKIRGGIELDGKFTVPEPGDISDNTVVEFVFTRPAGGRSVNYDLSCTKL